MFPDLTQAPLYVWLAPLALSLGVLLLAIYQQQQMGKFQDTPRTIAMKFWDALTIYEGLLMIVGNIFILIGSTGDLLLASELLSFFSIWCLIAALIMGTYRLYKPNSSQNAP